MTPDNQFIQQYTPLVRTITRQYPIPSIPQEDLMQEGYIGLLEAAKHFNPELGVTFQSYAACWVRKYITEAIRRYGYIITLPQHHTAEHVFSEKLDRVVASDEGEPLTYEDVLQSADLLPDEQLQHKEAIEAWEKLKNQQKTQKKCINVGKFIQKYVNK